MGCRGRPAIPPQWESGRDIVKAEDKTEKSHHLEKGGSIHR